MRSHITWLAIRFVEPSAINPGRSFFANDFWHYKYHVLHHGSIPGHGWGSAERENLDVGTREVVFLGRFIRYLI